MPHFHLVPLEEATRLSGTNSRRQQMLQEYSSFVSRVGNGQAGKLAPSDGETPMAVRRRLTTAAKQVGKDLVTRREGDVVYFWVRPATRRRGRPRRSE
jgi:hypothetical protein